MIFAIGGVPPFSGFPGKVLIFQGAIQNGNYIGLALMIVTNLIAMYSLFRVMFVMYFGDSDGEEVKFKKIPAHRKGILGLLVAVITSYGNRSASYFKSDRKCYKPQYEGTCFSRKCKSAFEGG